MGFFWFGLGFLVWFFFACLFLFVWVFVFLFCFGLVFSIWFYYFAYNFWLVGCFSTSSKRDIFIIYHNPIFLVLWGSHHVSVHKFICEIWLVSRRYILFVYIEFIWQFFFLVIQTYNVLLQFFHKCVFNLFFQVSCQYLKHLES